MDLGKADIETIWRNFSHTKMNAVKEHHTCEKTAEESHNHDKGYSIKPWRRQSKTHSIPEHIIQPVTKSFFNLEFVFLESAEGINFFLNTITS